MVLRGEKGHLLGEGRKEPGEVGSRTHMQERAGPGLFQRWTRGGAGRAPERLWGAPGCGQEGGRGLIQDNWEFGM